MPYKIQCGACRKVLYTTQECEKLLCTAHNERLGENKSTSQDEIVDSGCESVRCNNMIYLNEDVLPQCIKEMIGDNWTKGKIDCRYCTKKIGGYDFVSGLKCDCGEFVLPAVHLVKRKVDLVKES